MKSPSTYSKIAVTQVGNIAHKCCALRRQGKVLASLSKAIYLLTEDDELFWITAEDSPMHQRCMTISTALPEFQIGSPILIEQQCLTIDNAFVFDMENALVWSAPRLDLTHDLNINELAQRIQSFCNNLDIYQAKGFGNCIQHILSLSRNSSTSTAFESTDPVLLFAQPIVLELVHASLNRNISLISQNAGALIGLGSGLTPSGDDFVGGMLFAINILQTVCSNLNFMNEIIAVEDYRSKTHIISFTFLKDLANGQAIEPLHQIINGLISGKHLERIYPCVSQLTRVGHSTGWDLLAGLLTGLLSMYQNSRLITSRQMI